MENTSLLASQISTVTFCTCRDRTAAFWSAIIVSTSICSGVHLHQTRLICARLVGPFGPLKEETGVSSDFFLLLENCFSLGAAPYLFDFGNQSVLFFNYSPGK